MYPAGPWEYLLFYEENFSTARAGLEADTRGAIRSAVSRRALHMCGGMEAGSAGAKFRMSKGIQPF
jgi:hypothetical protein